MTAGDSISSQAVSWNMAWIDCFVLLMEDEKKLHCLMFVRGMTRGVCLKFQISVRRNVNFRWSFCFYPIEQEQGFLWHLECQSVLSVHSSKSVFHVILVHWPFRHFCAAFLITAQKFETEESNILVLFIYFHFEKTSGQAWSVFFRMPVICKDASWPSVTKSGRPYGIMYVSSWWTPTPLAAPPLWAEPPGLTLQSTWWMAGGARLCSDEAYLCDSAKICRKKVLFRRNMSCKAEKVCFIHCWWGKGK